MEWRDEATRYIWVVYGIVQSIITLCMALDVIEGITLITVVTAVALVLYVAANELLGRPTRRGQASPTPRDQKAQQASSVPEPPVQPPPQP